MTEKWPNGGYAFPAEYRHDGEPWVNPGMTLRDWFAGQALAGFMSVKPMHFDPVKDAEYFYALADAMLEVRK